MVNQKKETKKKLEIKKLKISKKAILKEKSTKKPNLDLTGTAEYSDGGRIDSGIMNSNNKNIKRELYDAMTLISITNQGPEIQNNSMGCSIKWEKSG